MASKHERAARMKQAEAEALAAEINEQKLPVLAEAIEAKQKSWWNIRLTHKPNTPLARSLTITSAKDWPMYREMWNLDKIA